MSKKFRLFASVAAPFVSLPLMMQPAGAAPPRPAVEAGQMPGIVEVQQQIIVPPGAPGAQEGEGQQRPRRKPAEEQQQAPPQAQQQEQPRRQRPAEPEASPREAAPREAAPRQAPQAERPAAEAPAQERPRRQQQETGQGQGQGQGGNDAQPRRQRDQAAPQTEQPAAREAQQPKPAPAEKRAETPRPERPATNRAATPDATPQAPAGRNAQERSTQPPAVNRAATPETAPQAPANRNAQDRNAAPAQNQAETPKPSQPPATNRAATPGAAPENPARGNATGQAPAQVPGQAPGTGTAQDRRTAPPAATGQAAPGQQVPGEAPRRQTTEGQPPVALPGQPQGQQATGAQPGTQPTAPQTATTPQQVERAKELARDPAAARSGEQVVLPVENGAAVLDSAKETPSARPPRAGERPRRPQQQADQQQLAPPKSDAEAQAGTRVTRQQQQDIRQLSEERGQRLDRRPDFERPQGWEFRDAAGRDGNRDRTGGDRDRDGGRVIISIDNQTVVRHDDSRRFYSDRDRAPQYEQLRDGRVREVIVRDDGTRIITVRNSYGEIVQRSRVVKGGEEYVLYYSPELMDNRRGRDYVWRDPGDDLPPMRLSVPLDDYIIDTSTEPDRDYYEFLEQPPVERVERVYSLDEVRYSARIRDKVPRIDLDTLTFATGSAEIPMNQASSLRKVADAISKVLEKDPSETFLIEGHTDAVGSDDSNLILSDQRAESVARVLTDAFNIPPENLTTQGYGERYLKVRTDGPEQENRRVTIRRITPLVKPVASNQ